MKRDRLAGKLTAYPANKEGTTGPVIPWVEVCHCDNIPVSAITSYLLVCPVDYRRFKKGAALDQATLAVMEQEFQPIVTSVRNTATEEHASG